MWVKCLCAVLNKQNNNYFFCHVVLYNYALEVMVLGRTRDVLDRVYRDLFECVSSVDQPCKKKRDEKD